ncbi:MAG: hypothetical protein HeimC3_47170 [Candidatus Heimdallarchaeota archaeon LC_3]|nr:MAG: hypothetical protein HeimC3_47170 [Candidatus Heimdallarchaeota archaeon LC_3]
MNNELFELVKSRLPISLLENQWVAFLKNPIEEPNKNLFIDYIEWNYLELDRPKLFIFNIEIDW